MNLYILFFILLLTSGATIFLITKHYYESKAGKTYQNLLQILDRAVHGKLQENIYDESMDAAVTARLNRLVQITMLHRKSARKERDTVKSLISDVSHQVRTPLTNIMLYTGLLKEQAISPDALHLAEKLQKQAERLDFFIKELVKSSYAEQEMIAIRPQRTDIMEIIHAACQTVELAAMKKGIALAVREGPAAEKGTAPAVREGPAAGIFCYADPKWTVEALANVLENAVKYSPENSAIHIFAILYESFVCIEVRDPGIGIREEEQGLVFGRFYRSEDVKGISGFGIGLYLVREVLARQGGYVRIRSEYGKGTAVQMYLSRFAAGGVAEEN